jgi:hypothetical protein
MHHIALKKTSSSPNSHKNSTILQEQEAKKPMFYSPPKNGSQVGHGSFLPNF